MQKISSCLAALILTLTACAQVPVRFEPRHHNVFENDFVRILNVFIPPGDTTQYHIHHTPSVFITYTKTRTGSELLGKAPVSSISEAGSIRYDSLVLERVHRVWNEDSTWFHVMDIELIGKSHKADLPLLKNNMLQLLFNEEQANIYKLQIPALKKTTIPASEKGMLIISLDNADVNIFSDKTQKHLLMQAGHYQWIDAGKMLSIENNIANEAGFAVLQFK